MRLDITKFAVLMQNEISANEHKGDWDTWKPSREEAIEELQHHVRKLIVALRLPHPEIAKEYAADTANICMKIAEEFGT